MRAFIKRLIRGGPRIEHVPVLYEPNIAYDNNLLAHRTALVTGAASNIGRAIAEEMKRQGADIVAVDIDEAALGDLTKELGGPGSVVRSFVADVGSESAIDDLVEKLDKQGLTVDVLVNNVGIHTDLEGSTAGSFSSWQASFETNVIGPFRLTRMIVDRLVERSLPGCVIFVSSIHQWQTHGSPAYSASKASIGMIVKELADSLAVFGIRVNAIAPGPVISDEGEGTRVLRHVPLYGTAIPPRYIGRSAVYLASEYFSRHTTGSVVVIDAGILARGFPKGRPQAWRHQDDQTDDSNPKP